MWTVCEETRPSSSMVSFNVDPQWSGLLFSIYCRHEKSYLPGGFPSPDVLATCAFQGPQLDADWLALAGTLGFELCRLSDTWALVFESVKATSVVLLLGAGGLVCYKLYHHYKPRPPESSSVPPPEDDSDNGASPVSTLIGGLGVGLNFIRQRQQLLSPGEEPSYGNVKAEYFGPSRPSDDKVDAPYLGDKSASSSEASGDESDCMVEGNCSRYGLSSPLIKERTRSWLLRRSRTPTSYLSNNKHSSENGSRNIRQNHHNRKHSSSLPGTPGHHLFGSPKHCSDGLSWQKHGRLSPEGEESIFSQVSQLKIFKDVPENIKAEEPKLLGQIPLDGLQLTEYQRFPRDGSFDSTCSDLSLDVSIMDPSNSSTIEVLDNLQKEIDSLINNCEDLGEEFVHVKMNRNVPGMSKLLTSNDEEPTSASNDVQLTEAKACFQGLYSLTHIQHSISETSDLSNLKSGSNIDSFDSFEWDSPKSCGSNKDIKTGSKAIPEASDEDNCTLEWDSNDLTAYPEVSRDTSDEPNLLQCMANLELDLETELRGHMSDSTVTSHVNSRSATASPVGKNSSSVIPEETLKDKSKGLWLDASSIDSPSTGLIGPLDLCSSVSEASSSEQASPLSASLPLLGTHLDVCNIGPRIDVMQYAATEWQSTSKNAMTIKSGYSHIQKDMGFSAIRVVRGDNYCALRATVFLCLKSGIEIPSGENTFAHLRQAIDDGCSWILNWQFARRLSYNNNVLFGIRTCLEYLDNVATHCQKFQDLNAREAELVKILNSNGGTTDLHVMEAVKLHMMASAMHLHDTSILQNEEIPLFATLLFARSSSETPRDFMNNHLQDVGCSGGVEQVEMFLLGYAMGVTIAVVRPGSFGSTDFVCDFPDAMYKWPKIYVCAEDDRHYNVLL